jgi:hypothetical protein
VPAYVSATFTHPRELYELGQLVLGNADGYLPAMRLHHEAQLFYPVADGMTVLGYDLVSGMTATVTELVGGNALKQPIDRGATALLSSTQFNGTGPTLSANLYTYTVPTGKWLLLEYAKIRMRRTVVATTQGANSPLLALAISGGTQAVINLPGNLFGDERESIIASPIYLPAGTVVSSDYTNGDTGGTVNYRVSIAGLVFDA